MPFFNSLSPAQRRVLGWSALSLAALLLLWLPGVVFDPSARGSIAFVEFAREMVARTQGA